MYLWLLLSSAKQPRMPPGKNGKRHCHIAQSFLCKEQLLLTTFSQTHVS